MMLRAWLVAFLPLLSLAAAELGVAPFTPAPGDAATLRKLAGPAVENPAVRHEQWKTALSGPAPETPPLFALLDLLEGGRIESGCAGAVNSLAFADPGKRKLQILLWNTGAESETAGLAVSDADRFFLTGQVSRSLRQLLPGMTKQPEAEFAKSAVSNARLTFDVSLPPGAAVLVELQPEGAAPTAVRIDANHTLTLRIPQVPGSGHLRFGFETRAESPAPVTLEVVFMRRQRFLAIRKFTVTAGTEWKPYSERYPIPAGTTHVTCKASGGPAEIRSLGLRPDKN